MRKILILLMLGIVSCKFPSYFDSKFEDKSQRRIYVNARFYSPINSVDTLASTDSVAHREFDYIRPSKSFYVIWGEGYSVSESFPKNMDVFRIYVFSYDSILKYGYRTCRDNNWILARYDIAKDKSEAIYKDFKTLYYPPTQAMRDAGIGIYLSEEGQKDMEEAQ